jgi:hypothetical protein
MRGKAKQSSNVRKGDYVLCVQAMHVRDTKMRTREEGLRGKATTARATTETKTRRQQNKTNQVSKQGKTRQKSVLLFLSCFHSFFSFVRASSVSCSLSFFFPCLPPSWGGCCRTHEEGQKKVIL